jgi:hypothetical protein
MMRWDCKDIDRDAIILELMLEAGLTDAPELADSLKALESFASMPAPVPGPALAAMLAGSAAEAAAGVETTAAVGVETTIVDSTNNLPLDELGKRRQLRKHRPVVVGAAVLTAMGLGVGGVAAASGGFSKGTPEFMQSLISGWAPAWTTAPPSLVPPAPAQDSPKVATHPAPVDLPPTAPPVAGPSADPVAPAPASTGEAEHEPAAPVAVPAPAAQPSQERSEAPKAAHGGPRSDSQGILPQPKTAIPSTATAKDLQSGVQQAVGNAQDDVSLKPAGTSLRWLLRLLSR